MAAELIKEEDAKKALTDLLVKCPSTYVVELHGDLIGLQGYFNKQALLDILLVKRFQMQENYIDPTYHLYQPGSADFSEDSDDLYLDGEFRVAEIESYIETKWGDLVTKEQYDAADAYLDSRDHSAWIDVPGTGDEVKLDGWFTVEDLEAVITMKKYLLQNPEARTDA